MLERGKVIWYDPRKGFGFLAPDRGGADVLVHARALERSGITELAKGDHVIFEIETRDGRSRAAALEIVERAADERRRDVTFTGGF